MSIAINFLEFSAKDFFTKCNLFIQKLRSPKQYTTCPQKLFGEEKRFLAPVTCNGGKRVSMVCNVFGTAF
jgi:hypothetical protein